MSTDYDVVCDVCRVRAHAGQEMAGNPSFACGSKDPNAKLVAAFMFHHVWCGKRGCRVIVADVAEARPEDGYERRENWEVEE